MYMDAPARKPRVILHFCSDPATLVLREALLTNVGYLVVNSNNGFEAIRWSASGRVDAVVLDLDRNHAEVRLIAEEIKRLKPEIPAILWTETKAVSHGLGELSDAVVTKDSDHEILLQFLTELLPGKANLALGPIPLTLPLLAETVSP
jgi:DNA-binding NtrC family response regulator